MNCIKSLSFLLLITFLSACNHNSNDDNPGSNNNNGATPAQGQWKITYFFDKQEETSNYSSYVFDFGSNGSFKASKGSDSWSGTWQTGVDDSTDKLVLDFSGVVPSALSDLEEDWHIITMDADFIHLEHTSGGNGDTDVLKFSKI